MEGGKWGGKRTGLPTLPKVNRMKLKAGFSTVNHALEITNSYDPTLSVFRAIDR